MHFRIIPRTLIAPRYGALSSIACPKRFVLSKPTTAQIQLKNKKHLGSIAVLMITWIGSVNTASRAGTVTGTFEGLADIEIQQFVQGQQVGVTDYSNVPSTLNFIITATPTSSDPLAGTLQFSLTNSIFSLNTNTLPDLFSAQYVDKIASITDGIPGQSADVAFGAVTAFVYHLWALTDTGVTLVDPTGEFIGPNGDGDPSNVHVNAQYTYEMLDFEDTSQIITTSFMTVPEPSSIVMAASGALLVLAVVLCKPVA
jgi:hypothetical protein